MRNGLGRASHAHGTSRGYECDWRVFRRWCKSAGRDHLPATSDTVELYVTWLLVQLNRKVSTAARHAATIAYFHRQAGHTNPVNSAVREVINAVRRRRLERPKGKAAIEPDALLAAVKTCDPHTNLGSRDRALLVLGFASSLRRSELCALNLADVTFEEKGLAIFVRRSKTDQDGHGRLVGVWAGRRPSTDPVRVLNAWLLRRGSWEGPLFCRVQTGDVITKRAITGDAVSDIVKKAVSKTGRNPAEYGAHSLRAGAVTTSAELGRSDQEIMGLSGHASPSVMRMYVRKARLFSGRNPLAGAL